MNSSIVIFASRYLGYQCIEYLAKNKYTISFIVLASAEDRHIEELANIYSIPYAYHYKGIQNDIAKRHEKKGDWLISFWSTHIIRAELIDCFKNTLNVHPSLVPLNQGNDCASWTIRDQTPAGVSIMTIKKELDKGDVYCYQEYPYSFPITGKQLYDSLLDQCVNFFKEKWSDICAGKLKPKKQSVFSTYHTRSDTNFDRCKKSTEIISLDEVINWILAHDFYPLSSAEVIRNGKKYRLKLSVEEIK